MSMWKKQGLHCVSDLLVINGQGFFAVESSVDGPGRWITLHRFPGMESDSLKVKYNEPYLHLNSLSEVRAVMFKF